MESIRKPLTRENTLAAIGENWKEEIGGKPLGRLKSKVMKATATAAFTLAGTPEMCRSLSEKEAGRLAENEAALRSDQVWKELSQEEQEDLLTETNGLLFRNKFSSL